MSFNHFDARGNAIMVDVSQKTPTMRTAVAGAVLTLKPETVQSIVSGRMAKGDVLGVARLSGIAGAKKTPDLIPLSHPLAIHHVAIEFEVNETEGTIGVMATVRAFERTGVEMEAMTAATIAALTVYDMCKGSDKGIVISDVKLHYKEGGKSGVYKREA
ncbi:cyclic pyranopterin monophosphate synthase MoaC [Geomonas terrae]|uniref:Cyclic pyranopterin monophosphate synthase n=1 Tax=Geomonas terrae TaxID=2562681 RepID=A0A4S1CGK8_9BACT|nr:cyclic pyranopterin monophosphate synthase MoaC [Geomonas terrae]TGU72196.1 cyclic pyranopterin monophosphate synthase MoaC [Geomonas terrae]